MEMAARWCAFGTLPLLDENANLGTMRRPPQLPSLELFRQILRGEKPTGSSSLKPTGRYFVSAATFKGLLLAVKDISERVSARSTGELHVEWEGRIWKIVRSTAIKDAIQIEYET